MTLTCNPSTLSYRSRTFLGPTYGSISAGSPAAHAGAERKDAGRARARREGADGEWGKTCRRLCEGILISSCIYRVGCGREEKERIQVGKGGERGVIGG
eukprot:764219-Hanusia_phi.AAC.2